MADVPVGDSQDKMKLGPAAVGVRRSFLLILIKFPVAVRINPDASRLRTPLSLVFSLSQSFDPDPDPDLSLHPPPSPATIARIPNRACARAFLSSSVRG